CGDVRPEPRRRKKSLRVCRSSAPSFASVTNPKPERLPGGSRKKTHHEIPTFDLRSRETLGKWLQRAGARGIRRIRQGVRGANLGRERAQADLARAHGAH